jgi:predicted RND superfamily exporter protein
MILFGILLQLSVIIVGTLILGWIVNHYAIKELHGYVKDLNERVRKAELERLSKLPTKSRIKFKPDI